MNSISSSNVPTWTFHIDLDGNFFHDGVEWEEENLLLHFMQTLQKEKDHWLAFCQGERCLFYAEDTPYVVQDFQMLENQILLRFKGGYEEILDPSTLQVGKDSVFYCRVRQKEFEARFHRKAFFELAKSIGLNPEDGFFYLILGKKKYRIEGVRMEKG